MATTKGFPVGAQWVNAFTASGLSVGTPVRIQNLTGGAGVASVTPTAAPIFQTYDSANAAKKGAC